MLEFIFERYNYWAIIVLMMIGLYITFQAENLIKRLVGLSVFQTSVFLFYITLGKISGGSAPILYGKDYPKKYDDHGSDYHGQDGHQASPSTGETDALGRPFVDAQIDPAHPAAALDGLKEVYSNPLPHVLILTAIVVGVATLAVGLAITVRIREAYGTIEMDEVRAADIKMAEDEAASETA